MDLKMYLKMDLDLKMYLKMYLKMDLKMDLDLKMYQDLDLDSALKGEEIISMKKEGVPQEVIQRPDPSCESMKSDFSMESPPYFKAGQSADE
ncbi:hypothetical protein NQZ68_028547, partial [Dissostichus eleginoides]